MGGDYYERPVMPAPPKAHKEQQHSNPHPNPKPVEDFSEDSQKIFSGNNSLHKSNDPKRFFTENLICKNQNPIVFALDVTGSMGDWPKVINIF